MSATQNQVLQAFTEILYSDKSIVEKGKIMSMWLISGLVIFGLTMFIGYIETHYALKREEPETFGKLKFGWGLLILGLVCLVFSVLALAAFFVDNDVWEKTSELVAVIGILLFFGFGAIYCFGEYFKVQGTYDEKEICFSTPWTGIKKEKWSNLISVNYNESANWYALKFNSGKIIRLSTLLSGYIGVLQILESKGYGNPK